MPRRGENIYKRKDGRWEARYIKEITVDGKKKYGSVYADSYKFGILLALYTGVRVGELCALKWEDITDEHIVINKTMMRIKNDTGKTEIKIGSPKSNSSKRITPTPQCLLPLINRFRKDGYILSSDKLEFTEPRLMQIKFEKVIKACKI